MGLDAPVLGLLLVLATTTVMRFFVGADRPLWLDEAQTGVLAIQPNLAAFVRQCMFDINAPLYAVLAALWAQVSGFSDPALRFLPAVFGALAPLTGLAPGSQMDRTTRLTWCVLLACWTPGLVFSQDARCYTLVFALAVANTLAFIALMANPSRGGAWRWAIISSLMILAHYFGVVLAGLQGAIFLAVHRRHALAAWPAALAFAPALAALAVHVRGLVVFTTPATTWIALNRPWEILDALGFLFDGLSRLLMVLLWMATAWILVRLRKGPSPVSHAGASPWPAVAAGAALAAAAIAVTAGFFAPVYVARYLTAFAPGALLASALIIARVNYLWRLPVITLTGLMFSGAIVWATGARPARDIHTYNFEWASAALIKTHPARLVFLWDNPLRPDKRQLAALGGFFFARGGQPVRVDPVVLARGEDPNQVLLAHASAPGSAILWISDRYVRGTAANLHPPAIARLDPTWLCRNFGDRQYRIIACTKDPAAKAAFAAAPARR